MAKGATIKHPLRPYTLDYIKALSNDNFIELHGDKYKDDKAMVVMENYGKTRCNVYWTSRKKY